MPEHCYSMPCRTVLMRIRSCQHLAMLTLRYAAGLHTQLLLRASNRRKSPAFRFRAMSMPIKSCLRNSFTLPRSSVLCLCQDHLSYACAPLNTSDLVISHAAYFLSRHCLCVTVRVPSKLRIAIARLFSTTQRCSCAYLIHATQNQSLPELGGAVQSCANAIPFHAFPALRGSRQCSAIT